MYGKALGLLRSLRGARKDECEELRVFFMKNPMGVVRCYWSNHSKSLLDTRRCAMQVYFRPPEYHPEISGQLLFPNIRDVPPTGFVHDILGATRAEDVDRYILWQQDLLGLTKQVNEYLCALSSVAGCAILYYKSYPIRRRGDALGHVVWRRHRHGRWAVRSGLAFSDLDVHRSSLCRQ